MRYEEGVWEARPLRIPIQANLAAVGWVHRGYSEQYSGSQTVIVLYGLPILKEMETRVPSLRPRD